MAGAAAAPPGPAPWSVPPLGSLAGACLTGLGRPACHSARAAAAGGYCGCVREGAGPVRAPSGLHRRNGEGFTGLLREARYASSPCAPRGSSGHLGLSGKVAKGCRRNCTEIAVAFCPMLAPGTPVVPTAGTADSDHSTLLYRGRGPHTSLGHLHLSTVDFASFALVLVSPSRHSPWVTSRLMNQLVIPMDSGPCYGL